MDKHLHRWEKAALCALCLMLLLACRVQGEREALAGGVLRLHVIAVSDAPEEQAQRPFFLFLTASRTPSSISGLDSGSRPKPLP